MVCSLGGWHSVRPPGHLGEGLRNGPVTAPGPARTVRPRSHQRAQRPGKHGRSTAPWGFCKVLAEARVPQDGAGGGLWWDHGGPEPAGAACSCAHAFLPHPHPGLGLPAAGEPRGAGAWGWFAGRSWGGAAYRPLSETSFLTAHRPRLLCTRPGPCLPCVPVRTPRSLLGCGAVSGLSSSKRSTSLHF